MPRESFYNPEMAPSPTTWLELPEQERIRVVSAFHTLYRQRSGNAKVHAAIHVVVENQVAMGFGPTVRAIARLQTQGLSRHDSVHAVGSVVASYLFEAMRDSVEGDAHSLQSEMNAAIERLDAQSWRQQYDE